MSSAQSPMAYSKVLTCSYSGLFLRPEVSCNVRNVGSIESNIRLVLGRSRHQIVWEVEVDSVAVFEFGFVLLPGAILDVFLLLNQAFSGSTTAATM